MPAFPDSAQLVRFLNALPSTVDADAWLDAVRNALRTLLGDVDRVTVHVNLDFDIAHPREYESHLTVMLGPDHDGVDRVEAIARTDSASIVEELGRVFRAEGFLVERHYPPTVVELAIDGCEPLGRLILWRSLDHPPVSERTLATVEMLRPFLTFLVGDCIARHQATEPVDRFFLDALEELVHSAGLSMQEQRVVVLQLLGRSYGEIATELEIALNTVRRHVQSIYRKTGTTSLAQLFARYFTPELHLDVLPTRTQD